MKEIPVTFKSKGKQIVGILHLPNKKKVPVIILLHGWAMGKFGNPQFTFVRAAREFSKAGFAVLRFDFRGVGDSEGNWDDYGTETSLEDLNAALKYAQTIEGIDKNKIGVLGWSNGGETAIIGASENKKIKCIVTWASPADHKDLWAPALFEEWRKRKKIIIAPKFNGLTVSWKPKEFNYHAYISIRKLKIPIMIINGTEDFLVFPNQAEKLYKNANKPKKLVLIKGAHHGFYGEQNKKQLFRESINWFKKWL